MSDQFLYEFQKQPSLDFRNRLYAEISSNQPHKSRIFPALAYGLISIVLGLSLLFAVSPAARVYAQEIVYQIGQWIISYQPTSAEQFENKLQSGEIGVTDVSESEAIDWQAPTWMSVDEAQTISGFHVFQLQLDDFAVTPIFREVQTGKEEISVTTVYQLQEVNLVFRQTKNTAVIDLVELPVGDAEVKPVIVSTSDGYWIEGLRLSTYVNDQNEVEPKYANVLIWETDEFEFWLQSSPGLSFEDMLQLAEQIY